MLQGTHVMPLLRHVSARPRRDLETSDSNGLQCRFDEYVLCLLLIHESQSCHTASVVYLGLHLLRETLIEE